jgi:hypothetical protein
VQVDGSDARCVEENLWKESSVGKEEEDVDGVIEQSLCQNLSGGVCAVEHWDRM